MKRFMRCGLLATIGLATPSIHAEQPATAPDSSTRQLEDRIHSLQDQLNSARRDLDKLKPSGEIGRNWSEFKLRINPDDQRLIPPLLKNPFQKPATPQPFEGRIDVPGILHPSATPDGWAEKHINGMTFYIVPISMTGR